ncbi:MAG TPA: EscU/YscU/HrcU family type III secretion system export apparatus switch protein [Blastocatellia bacterium]|nr:EscU/YscU/HrcU family type III secretion system export apparatus switch protein [Blastocatellia bacterium]
MADNRTEKATPRRRHKAREEGQVARSRELSSSLALLATIMVIAWQPLFAWRDQWRGLWSKLLTQATSGDIQSMTPLMRETVLMVARWAVPAMCAACGLSVLAGIAQGGLVFSPKALMPKFTRFNPASNLGKVFSFGGLSTTLKALVPMSFLVYLCTGIMTRDWAAMTLSAHANPAAFATWMLSRIFEVSWKASLIFLAWSGMDYVLQKFNYERQLRMSKEEVRQEGKETEGNPQIKGRIRRMQRQVRRRFKLQDVARATVVVTNPTHFAVALEFRLESMAAPVVIAKGQNLLAQQIKKHALWNDVPIVENKPLAQALYKAVDVGGTIPETLYTAVAEILAFVFKTQGRSLQPQLSQRP